MGNGFFKRLLPRGFYGRAALILIVPIITVQLVVSVAFLQRYFEDITRQMTTHLARDLQVVLARPDMAPELAIMLGSGVVDEARAPYDLSGRIVAQELRALVAGIVAIDLASDKRRVRVGLRDGTVAVFTRTRVSASNPHQLLVLMAITSIVMTIVAFLFMRNQIRPIRRLARAAEAFGRGRVVPYWPAGASEVRAAGTAFLDMRNRIERHIDQRTLLLSGVSHDLRTPLTRMRLELSMMQGAEAEGLAGDVAEMQAMIDTFLEFAREDGGDAPEPVDARDLASVVAQKVARTGRTVDLVLPARACTVALRAGPVERALDNLVKNALRYGTRVRLSIVDGPERMRFVVEDDGPGIAADKRADAIRPFGRLDTARGDSPTGSVGLGLAIVTDVARAHGGTLHLDRSAELGGLRAELILPK